MCNIISCICFQYLAQTGTQIRIQKSDGIICQYGGESVDGVITLTCRNVCINGTICQSSFS